MSRSVERREAARLGEVRALTRRERAAAELALEVLRSDVLRYHDRVPTQGDLLGYLEILGWGSVGLANLAYPAPYYDGTPRLLWRARLALFIRARLRADRGDCGPLECADCREPGHLGHRAGDGCRECWLEHWQETGEVLSEEKRPRYERVRITPLWQRAGEARR